MLVELLIATKTHLHCRPTVTKIRSIPSKVQQLKRTSLKRNRPTVPARAGFQTDRQRLDHHKEGNFGGLATLLFKPMDLRELIARAGVGIIGKARVQAMQLHGIAHSGIIHLMQRTDISPCCNLLLNSMPSVCWDSAQESTPPPRHGGCRASKNLKVAAGRVLEIDWTPHQMIVQKGPASVSMLLKRKHP